MCIMYKKIRVSREGFNMFKWEMQCFLIIQGKYDKDKNSCQELKLERRNKEKEAKRREPEEVRLQFAPRHSKIITKSGRCEL